MLLILFLLTSLLDVAGLGLIGPYVTLVVDPESLNGPLGRVVDWIGLPREQKPLLVAFGIVIFCIFLLKAVSSIGIHWVVIRFGQSQQLRLRLYLMQSYQALPYTNYLLRNSSEYIHSILNLTGQFSNVVITLLRAASDGIVGLMILIMLAWTNGPALALLLGLLGTMVFGYDRLFRKNLKSIGAQINRANTQMMQGIHESIEGLKEIRVLGHERHFRRKVREGARHLARYYVRQQIIQTMPRYLLELIMVTFIVLVVIGMLFLGQNLKTLLPALGVFGVAALRMMPSANMLSISLVQLRFSRDSISRLYQDLKKLKQLQSESPSEIEYNPHVSKTVDLHRESFRSLELQNLDFRYPNSLQNALQDISLQINHGESVGLIGPSGAGKTTLVDVLLGMLEPQAGSITFNGYPLSEVLDDWWSQVAYLPQQVFLIDNTLKRNVALGVDDAEIENKRLYEALRQARLSELLDQLPQDVETMLGERGMRLSGGQRQRVALARAFYHRRSVLVMDEATSSLDHETEQEIVDEIKHLKGRITMIVIAHRLTTVQHCDHIYRLEQSRIVETGSPEQVLQKVH